MAEQEEDFSSLTLPDRFTHKAWKVRKEGYEAATKEFDNAQTESAAVVKQFIQDPGLWKAAVADSNVAAHQEAVVALCSFLQIGGLQACTRYTSRAHFALNKLTPSRTRSLTLTLITEKGLTSTKPVTKQKSSDAILLYVELDKAEPVIDELIPLLSHKLPKVVASTLSAFTSIYHAYGCKTVEPKPVLKLLPKAYSHADKTVRAEAQKLTVELYRWLHESMKPLFWDELKPVQQQDLEKLFEPVRQEPAPKPERLLRSQQAAKAITNHALEVDEGDDVAENESNVDLEPEYMVIDIMSKVPKDLFDRLNSSKWKDRKDALDELQSASNCQAIEDGPFDEIIRALAKCILKDANIAVVTVAANCVELLARGLRKNFAKYRSTIVGPIMERLKERKQTVTDALGAALDSICAATSLMDCLEETLEFLKHKNPLVKLESTRFLVRSLRATKDAPGLPETKTISEVAKALVSDSQETQRNAAAEVLGVLLKIMGERIMNTHLEGLDDIRKAKVKEYCEAAEVKAQYKPKSSAAPKAAPDALTTKKSGSKKLTSNPAAVKRPAPLAADDHTAPALQPKLSSRPSVSKLATSTTARILKPPAIGLAKKVQSSGYGQTTTAVAASPRRVTASPAPGDETVSMPKVPRGLTGRTLSKTAPAISEPVIITSNLPMSSTLSNAERNELDELRNEVERLRSTNESLRAEHIRFSTQIHELQAQRDQLIEEHTRDMLSAKAKETQLVRARAETEQVEQTSQQLELEVNRLKRELSRADRAYSPNAYSSRDAYLDRAGPAPLAYTARSNAAAPPGGSRGEGKENRDLDPGNPAAVKMSHTLSSSLVGERTKSASPIRLAEGASSRFSRPLASHTRAGLAPQHAAEGLVLRTSMKSPEIGDRHNTLECSVSRSVNGSAGNGESGNESWKRAAEVTQNLKARIELLKVSEFNPTIR